MQKSDPPIVVFEFRFPWIAVAGLIGFCAGALVGMGADKPRVEREADIVPNTSAYTMTVRCQPGTFFGIDEHGKPSCLADYYTEAK